MTARIPVLDLRRCTRCDSCIAICPEVFMLNAETHMIAVLDLPTYPEGCVEEAMVICPESCISWGDR